MAGTVGEENQNKENPSQPVLPASAMIRPSECKSKSKQKTRMVDPGNMDITQTNKEQIQKTDQPSLFLLQNGGAPLPGGAAIMLTSCSLRDCMVESFSHKQNLLKGILPIFKNTVVFQRCNC